MPSTAQQDALRKHIYYIVLTGIHKRQLPVQGTLTHNSCKYKAAITENKTDMREIQNKIFKKLQYANKNPFQF